MNWGKVNGILIGAFIIVNICLVLILYENRTKYELTASRLTELQINLDRYHIAMYDFIPSYEPMQRLGIVRQEFDPEQIAGNLFQEAVYTKEEENGIVEYKNEDRKLIFYRNLEIPEEYIYEEYWKEFNATSNAKAIQQYTDLLVNKIVPDSSKSNLSLSSIKLLNNSNYEICYIDSYEGIPIFGSYIRMVLEPSGKIVSTIKLIQIKNFIKEKHYLVEPEEMLYNLGERIGKDKEEQTIIKEIDIGYDAGDRMYQESKQDYIEPYYRIELLDGQVYYINAYTNEIVN